LSGPSAHANRPARSLASTTPAGCIRLQLSLLRRDVPSARVDRQRLRNRGPRPAVDYVRRRSNELDYATMENLVRSPAGHSWKIVEEVNPARPTWAERGDRPGMEQRLLVRRDGTPRQHIDAPFLALLAFYLDLQTWSAAEPERSGRWVAPCPIRDADLR
jgi:hypothetical protein